MTLSESGGTPRAEVESMVKADLIGLVMDLQRDLGIERTAAEQRLTDRHRLEAALGSVRGELAQAKRNNEDLREQLKDERDLIRVKDGRIWDLAEQVTNLTGHQQRLAGEAASLRSSNELLRDQNLRQDNHIRDLLDGGSRSAPSPVRATRIKPEPSFFTALRSERQKQREMWGDHHDDQHTHLEWLGILIQELASAALRPSGTHPFGYIEGPGYRSRIRKALIKVGAVCWAWEQALSRADYPQHVNAPCYVVPVKSDPMEPGQGKQTW